MSHWTSLHAASCCFLLSWYQFPGVEAGTSLCASPPQKKKKKVLQRAIKLPLSILFSNWKTLVFGLSPKDTLSSASDSFAALRWMLSRISTSIFNTVEPRIAHNIRGAVHWGKNIGRITSFVHWLFTSLTVNQDEGRTKQRKTKHHTYFKFYKNKYGWVFTSFTHTLMNPEIASLILQIP